jgi:hypothetical protein
VCGPQPGHFRIADAQRQLGAVDDVGQEQCAQWAHRNTFGTAGSHGPVQGCVAGSLDEGVRQRKRQAWDRLRSMAAGIC